MDDTPDTRTTENPTGWRCWCGDRRDHALKVSTRYAAAHVGPDYARTTENPEPRTERGKQEHLEWHRVLKDDCRDFPSGCSHAARLAAIETEAAQGAAPRAEGLEVEAWIAGYVAGREDGPGQPDDEVAERAVDAVCAIRMDVTASEGAAPRAEGLDVDVLLAAERVVQGWNDEISLGGMVPLIVDLERAMERRILTLSRPSDERDAVLTPEERRDND